MMNAVQFHNLSKHYQNGSVKALDSLCLKIKQGQLFGLVGPNGAGKTTLIYIIAGLIRRSSGKMVIFDQEIGNRDFLFRRRIGFVLDRPMYFDKLTVKEYLEFVAGMYDIPKQDTQGKIEELVNFFDLESAAGNYIETYSKGMKQKVSIAAAIIHEPDLLILDEPFDGIDTTSAEDIKQLLLQMNATGVTIVITSHQLELIEALCTECAILHKGQIVFQSKIDELEKQLQESGNSKAQTSLKEIFLQITSADRPHKSLSWLS